MRATLFFNIKLVLASVVMMGLFNYSSCKLTTKNASIPPEVKTIKVNYIENHARYVNPQLSPQLTDRLKQKFVSQTRLTVVNSDDAQYEISGYVTSYEPVTSGISNQQTASNNLNVSVHVIFKNRMDDKKSKESDVSVSFPFSANISFSQAEAALLDDVVKNVTDEMFNKVFSDW